MVQGSGSAIMFGLVVLGLFLVHCEVVQAKTYTVDWTFNITRWPKGKSFKPGDVIVFNYNPALHNVVLVNKRGYKNCITPRGAKVYQTGKDKIILRRGNSFIICNFVGHCESGMKMAISAL